MAIERKYADDATRSRAWRDRHPQKSRKVSRKWRQKNRETMALLNKRTKKHHALCVQWIKRRNPELYESLKREAKRQVPVGLRDEE